MRACSIDMRFVAYHVTTERQAQKMAEYIEQAIRMTHMMQGNMMTVSEDGDL